MERGMIKSVGKSGHMMAWAEIWHQGKVRDMKDNSFINEIGTWNYKRLSICDFHQESRTGLLSWHHLRWDIFSSGGTGRWRWWKIKSADPSQCALLSLTLSVTALGWGLQVVRGWGEVSIYLVVQWRRRDLWGFECHPVTRCTFFPCIIGPDDSSWKLPVNNLEVMSFIDSHIVFNLWLKPCGRKYKRIYK